MEVLFVTEITNRAVPCQIQSHRAEVMGNRYIKWVWEAGDAMPFCLLQAIGRVTRNFYSMH